MNYHKWFNSIGKHTELYGFNTIYCTLHSNGWYCPQHFIANKYTMPVTHTVYSLAIYFKRIASINSWEY